MATKKKLLQAAAGTAAASGGAGALNVEDVFSTYLYEGNGSINAIDNGIALGQENSGTSVALNLNVTDNSLTSSNDNDSLLISDNNIIDFGTGDFTVEFWVWVKDYGGSTYADIIGGGNSEFGIGIYGGTIYYSKNGVINPLSTDVTSYLNGWMHVAVARSSGTSRLFIDGVLKATNSSDNNSFASSSGVYVGRLGTRTYAVQGWLSNVRVVKGTALYTSAFTPPTSDLTAVSGTELLLCNGETPLVDGSSNSHSVTVNGEAEASTFGPFDAAEAGEGGLVWAKQRTGSSSQHALFDTENGTLKALASSSTAALATEASVTSFNANGFSLGNFNNTSGQDYASWTFRKAPKFFDVVTYTGTGSSLTIDHNLGVEPAVIIIKRTNTTGNWIVFTDVVDGTVDYLFLDATDASTDGSTLLSKTSTDFTLLQSFTLGNASGSEYVAYLFAHNDGDGEFGPDGDADIIKCGSYTGNGSSTGPEIDLGFEPQWLLIKDATSANNWLLFDNMRGLVTGGNDALLRPNLSDAELTSVDLIEATSTGFRIPTSDAGINGSGNTYIYIAIRRGPMAVPTDATEVFAIDEMDNSPTAPPTLYSGFPVDMAFYTNKSASSDRHISSRMIGDKLLQTNQTNAEIDYTYAEWDFMDGWFSYAGALSNYYSWMWKRAPNFFDVVAYTGDGVAGRTVSHNLGVAPEMMWVKRRDGSAGNYGHVYHKDLTSSAYYLYLNDTAAESNFYNIWNSTDPTSSVFSLGNYIGVNYSGSTYIAYLFASLDGVSKVGSYTGNGSTQNIDCGFSNGARFVMIKKASDTGQWVVFDTERGIVAGNDARLFLNFTTAETSDFDDIDPLSSGFTLNNVSLCNTSGATYIFYAIA